MLEDKDRIFQNLYNDFGADLTSAKKRGDWKNTKEILPQSTACFPCHRLHFDFEHCNQDDNTKAARCSASIEPATIIKAIKNGLHNASRK